MSADPFDPATPSLGTVIRKARERRRLGLRQLAGLAGLSPAFVTRVEQDLANPTWRSIEQLAAALESQPLLRLIADEAAIAGAAALVANESPLRRLLRQQVNIFYPVSLLAEFEVPCVLTGTAAALLQGFPTPVHELDVIVHDDDRALEALQRMLLAQGLLFVEQDPEQLRTHVARQWAIGDCGVNFSLAAELPPAHSVQLDDIEVRVVLPQALLDDPEVAATLRITPMRSSEL